MNQQKWKQKTRIIKEQRILYGDLNVALVFGGQGVSLQKSIIKNCTNKLKYMKIITCFKMKPKEILTRIYLLDRRIVRN